MQFPSLSSVSRKHRLWYVMILFQASRRANVMSIMVSWIVSVLLVIHCSQFRFSSCGKSPPPPLFWSRICRIIIKRSFYGFTSLAAFAIPALSAREPSHYVVMRSDEFIFKTNSSNAQLIEARGTPQSRPAEGIISHDISLINSSSMISH